MQVQPILDFPSTHENVEQAAANLGDRMRRHPYYQKYMQAIIDLEKDPGVRDLSIQIQTKRNVVFGGKGSPELNAELQRLELELEALPAIQAYRSAESEVRSFLHAVNALLSESLKVDFAANAKRGCSCGG